MPARLPSRFCTLLARIITIGASTKASSASAASASSRWASRSVQCARTALATGEGGAARAVALAALGLLAVESGADAATGVLDRLRLMRGGRYGYGQREWPGAAGRPCSGA